MQDGADLTRAYARLGNEELRIAKAARLSRGSGARDTSIFTFMIAACGTVNEWSYLCPLTLQGIG